jgi:transposase
VNSDSIRSQIAALQQQVRQLGEENAALRAQLEQERRQNQLLRQKLDALARRFFGQKSEQLNAAQLELLCGGLMDNVAELPSSVPPTPVAGLPSTQRSACGPQRVRTPDNLEVVRQVVQPQEVTSEPERWKRIGQEVTRLLDYQPGKFFWQETVRPKYVRVNPPAGPPVVAPAPARVADHCLAAPGLLAQILSNKFCDHLPFYRQEHSFVRQHGVYISRQQMVQWAEQSVRLLSAITRCLKAQLQRSRYVQVDETPVRYQDPDLPGKCGQGYLWTGFVPGQCVVYEWHASRAAACLESLLGAGYAGKVQCDGYGAYEAYAKDKPAIQLFGCMAHLRRGFFEAQEEAPRMAGWVLNQIGQLYGWEKELRQSRAGPALRAARRASHSRMVLERLHRALHALQPRYLPKSPMGQAIKYALGQWPVVKLFVDHGEVEIDNNLVENSIRPTAIGKKNWLFFGSEEAGTRNAVIFTLVENCRMHGIDPCAYLKDLLERLPTATNQEVESLTPLNWKKARQTPSRQAA